MSAVKTEQKKTNKKEKNIMKILTNNKDRADLFRYSVIRLQQAKKDEEFYLVGHTTFRRLADGAKLLRNE